MNSNPMKPESRFPPFLKNVLLIIVAVPLSWIAGVFILGLIHYFATNMNLDISQLSVTHLHQGVENDELFLSGKVESKTNKLSLEVMIKIELLDKDGKTIKTIERGIGDVPPNGSKDFKFRLAYFGDNVINEYKSHKVTVSYIRKYI